MSASFAQHGGAPRRLALPPGHSPHADSTEMPRWRELAHQDRVVQLPCQRQALVEEHLGAGVVALEMSPAPPRPERLHAPRMPCGWTAPAPARASAALRDRVRGRATGHRAWSSAPAARRSRRAHRTRPGRGARCHARQRTARQAVQVHEHRDCHSPHELGRPAPGSARRAAALASSTSPAAGQLLESELAHRLQHPIARLVGVALDAGAAGFAPPAHQRHRGPEALASGTATASAASRVKPPAKTASRRKSACSSAESRS